MKILFIAVPVIMLGNFIKKDPFTSVIGKKPAATTTIPLNQWKAALNLQLATLKIRINNFTPVDFRDTSSNTFRWYKKRDCIFQIGIRPNHVSDTFTLLPFRADPMTIYIQNLNKHRATASAENRKIKIRIDFEQAEREVRTNCVENFGCGGIGNPNFNIEGPAIEVLIEPVIRDGKLSYQNGEVRLFGKLNHEGFNVTVGVLQGIAKMFSFDVNSFIQKQGSGFMQAYLNSPTVVDDITNKLNRTLSRTRLSGFSLPANMRSITLDAAGNMVIIHD